MGIIPSTYTEKPTPGLEECAGLDYTKQEEKHKEHNQSTNNTSDGAYLFIGRCKFRVGNRFWQNSAARSIKQTGSDPVIIRLENFVRRARTL